MSAIDSTDDGDRGGAGAEGPSDGARVVAGMFAVTTVTAAATGTIAAAAALVA